MPEVPQIGLSELQESSSGAQLSRELTDMLEPEQPAATPEVGDEAEYQRQLAERLEGAMACPVLRRLTDLVPEGGNVVDVLGDPDRQADVARIVQRARGDRDVASKYRWNTPDIIELDHFAYLAAQYQGTPTPLTEFGKQLVTDRPTDEAANANWLVQLGRIDTTTAAIAVEVAQTNEQTAHDAYSAAEPFQDIASITGYQEDQIQSKLWNQAPDRRVALSQFKALVDLPVTADLRPQIGRLALQSDGVRLDYVQQYEDAVEAGLDRGLTAARQATGKDFGPAYIELLKNSDHARTKNLIGNIIHASSPDVVAHLDDLADKYPEISPDGLRTELVDYLTNQITEPDSAANALSTIMALDQDGMFTRLVAPAFRDQAPAVLRAALAHEDPAAGYAKLSATLDNPFVASLINNPSLSARLVQDIGSSYETWLQFNGELPPTPDRAMARYVESHLQQGFESPSESLQVLQTFELPPEYSIAATDALSYELVRAVIQRDNLDKLPTNATKIRTLMSNEAIRRVYSHPKTKPVCSAMLIGKCVKSTFQIMRRPSFSSTPKRHR